MEIEIDSVSYIISLYINGNELIFKIESKISKKIYLNNFSLDNFIQMHHFFKQFEKLDKLKNKLEKLIQKKKYKIEIINNIINFNLIYDEDEDPIKIELFLQDTSSNIEYDSLSKEMKKIIDNNELILGIDLGTTYSSAAIIIDEKINCYSQ